MRSAFISYSRADLEKATELAGDLIGLGHEVWMDKELAGGMVWWEQILKRIRESDVFVYLASPASLDSQACLREMRYAMALKKSILPIMIADKIDSESLPVAIQSLQLLDYSRSDKAALFSLAKALQGLPPSPPLPDPLPGTPAMPASYIAELREAVESEESLSFDAQTSLLVKLREQLKLQEKSTAVREVLLRFRRRRDLFAIVAEEIDAIEPSTLKKESQNHLISAIKSSDLEARPAIKKDVVPQLQPTDIRPLVSVQQAQNDIGPRQMSLLARFFIFCGLTWFLAAIGVPLLFPPIWRTLNGSEPPFDNVELGVVVWLLLLIIEVFRSLVTSLLVRAKKRLG